MIAVIPPYAPDLGRYDAPTVAALFNYLAQAISNDRDSVRLGHARPARLDVLTACSSHMAILASWRAQCSLCGLEARLINKQAEKCFVYGSVLSG